MERQLLRSQVTRLFRARYKEMTGTEAVPDSLLHEATLSVSGVAFPLGLGATGSRPVGRQQPEEQRHKQYR
jgi:hypothetical protein